MKEQRAALEMLIAPEAVGQARPSLVVSCALALAGGHERMRLGRGWWWGRGQCAQHTPALKAVGDVVSSRRDRMGTAL